MECGIMETLKRRMKKAVQHCKEERTLVKRLFLRRRQGLNQGQGGKWTIKDHITDAIPSHNGTVHTYHIQTDDGREFQQNGSPIHHSESQAEMENEKKQLRELND